MSKRPIPKHRKGGSSAALHQTSKSHVKLRPKAVINGVGGSYTLVRPKPRKSTGNINTNLNSIDEEKNDLKQRISQIGTIKNNNNDNSNNNDINVDIKLTNFKDEINKLKKDEIKLNELMETDINIKKNAIYKNSVYYDKRLSELKGLNVNNKIHSRSQTTYVENTNNSNIKTSNHLRGYSNIVNDTNNKVGLKNRNNKNSNNNIISSNNGTNNNTINNHDHSVLSQSDLDEIYQLAMKTKKQQNT